MKHFARVAFAAALALTTLTGCQEFQKIQDFIASASSTKINVDAVVLASQAFNASEVVAAGYLRLPICAPATRPVCREPSATPMIEGAILAGRKARDELQNFVRTHPDELGPQGVYDALITATTALESVTKTYKATVQAQR